jgi:hypothetical protein
MANAAAHPQTRRLLSTVSRPVGQSSLLLVDHWMPYCTWPLVTALVGPCSFSFFLLLVGPPAPYPSPSTPSLLGSAPLQFLL